jgi:RND family efflux transporter MFP subunit
MARLKIYLSPFLGLFLLAGGVSAAQPIEIVLEPVRSIVVSAPVDGVLEKIHVDEGDVVSAGATLVEFVRAAEILQVERAQEVLRKREFDYAGVEQLFKDNMTSETEKLEKEIERRVAELDLAQAKEQRDQRVVKAGHPGVVTVRYHEDGEYVERGTPLLALIDQSQLDARFYVRPEQGLNLRVGDRVLIRVPVLDLTVKCQVVFVDPAVDASSGLMRVRARIDNATGNLKSGLRGWVHLGEKEPLAWP